MQSFHHSTAHSTCTSVVPVRVSYLYECVSATVHQSAECRSWKLRMQCRQQRWCQDQQHELPWHTAVALHCVEYLPTPDLIHCHTAITLLHIQHQSSARLISLHCIASATTTQRRHDDCIVCSPPSSTRSTTMQCRHGDCAVCSPPSSTQSMTTQCRHDDCAAVCSPPSSTRSTTTQCRHDDCTVCSPPSSMQSMTTQCWHGDCAVCSPPSSTRSSSQPSANCLSPSFTHVPNLLVLCWLPYFDHILVTH